MKIAFIGQKGIPGVAGGVERYVEDLAVRLARSGEEVIVYTRPHYTPRELKTYRGVRLISLPSINTKHLDAISHTWLAAWHAALSGMEVIHFQSIGPALLCWLPKLLNPGVKIVSTLQSRDYEHQKWGRLAKLMLKLGERLMCSFSDEVMVVTKLMRDYVWEKYNLVAHYVPNGANLYQATGDNLLAEWGLAKENYVVAVSRLVKHKGLSYLLAAYQALGQTDKKLVIVGAGAFTDDYVNELQAAAADNRQIIFTGRQTGEVLAQLYANAYLFVQPSESEGLSLALLEAMARRVPVLVSDIAENLEAVGEAGFVFANKDVNDLTAQLRCLLAQPAMVRTRGEAGRARIAEHFNWDIIAREVKAVYETAAAKDLAAAAERKAV